MTVATDRCSLASMKALIITALAVAALAGCDVPPPQPNACEQAKTNGEMFGTPEDKGPCWGRVTAASQMGSIRSYMVEMPVPGYVVASITYDGSTLVGVSMARGW